ncbi:aldehyde dehydrogenase family protein [Novosphingobium sp.]|uniref:aldehyde dehydrogenase family protein n=1 Tax=Novosphingobium sp. TaxID=1874826 RepID=UPI0033426763
MTNAYAAAYLDSGALPVLPNGHFIDGQFQPPINGQMMDSLDPALGRPFAAFAAGDADDVERAVASATRGFAVWRKSTPGERHGVLSRMAALVRRDAALLAMVDSLDSGKALGEAEGDVGATARLFDYYAGIALTIEGTQIPLGQDLISMTFREPVGVTAHVIPWNYPTGTFARSIAACLAAGCSAVVKPAETTPFTALIMAQLLVEAGLPAGVVNVVTGTGVAAGGPLTEHPAIRHVTFTGSVTTGARVAQVAARNIASVTLELGGKSPLIALSDCDAMAVANGALWGIFSNAGQVCSAGSRLIIARPRHDEVVSQLVALTEALSVGHGLRGCDINAINSAAQLDRIAAHVDGARARGRTILTGGATGADDARDTGWFYRPTLIDDLPGDDACVTQEIFGPVLSIQIVDSDEAALAAANATEFGLMAGIYSRDITRALAMARDLDSGQVTINDYWAGGISVPFGGRKKSGYGREKGHDGISAFLSTKAVTIRLTPPPGA